MCDKDVAYHRIYFTMGDKSVDFCANYLQVYVKDIRWIQEIFGGMVQLFKKSGLQNNSTKTK